VSDINALRVLQEVASSELWPWGLAFISARVTVLQSAQEVQLLQQYVKLTQLRIYSELFVSCGVVAHSFYACSNFSSSSRRDLIVQVPNQVNLITFLRFHDHNNRSKNGEIVDSTIASGEPRRR
jgi:hypothetical protein